MSVAIVDFVPVEVVYVYLKCQNVIPNVVGRERCKLHDAISITMWSGFGGSV